MLLGENTALNTHSALCGDAIKDMEGLTMDRNTAQHIECTVKSCKFNDQQRKCTLHSILVDAIPGGTGKTADESMCASYHNK